MTIEQDQHLHHDQSILRIPPPEPYPQVPSVRLVGVKRSVCLEDVFQTNINQSSHVHGYIYVHIVYIYIYTHTIFLLTYIITSSSLPYPNMRYRDVQTSQFGPQVVTLVIAAAFAATRHLRVTPDVLLGTCWCVAGVAK